MPRLSRKKEKSKIIKKKNTKKITTKKNLKGGGEFGGSRLQKPNIQQKLSRKQINNIHKHNFVNANRHVIDNLIKDYSKKIIKLINFGCLLEHSDKKINNNAWQTCEPDAITKIKVIFEPIIEKLAIEIQEENEKKLEKDLQKTHRKVNRE